MLGKGARPAPIQPHSAPMTSWNRITLALYASLLLSGIGLARVPHGDVHRAILALTKKIAQGPASASLHLRRGQLHGIHKDWAKAERDYRRALDLEPSMLVARRALAGTFLRAGRPAEAEREVRRFLAACPGDADGWALLARTLTELGRHPGALQAWTRSTTGDGERRADLWLERTRALANLDATAALRDLDAATAQMGHPIVLELEALTLERQLRRFSEALTRVRHLTERARRKTAWRLLEAEVLEQAGRTAEARAVFLEVDRQARSELTRRRHIPKDWVTRTTNGLRRTAETAGGTH